VEFEAVIKALLSTQRHPDAPAPISPRQILVVSPPERLVKTAAMRATVSQDSAAHLV
jgi:hypothetical protein